MFGVNKRENFLNLNLFHGYDCLFLSSSLFVLFALTIIVIILFHTCTLMFFGLGLPFTLKARNTSHLPLLGCSAHLLYILPCLPYLPTHPCSSSFDPVEINLTNFSATQTQSLGQSMLHEISCLMISISGQSWPGSSFKISFFLSLLLLLIFIFVLAYVPSKLLIMSNLNV